MSPLPLVPGSTSQPLAPITVWVMVLGVGMGSPSWGALSSRLARSCSVCHALALPGWAISFASLEQVVAPLHPRSTGHICLSQCHRARVDPDDKQPHGCSVPQFPCL